MVWESVARQLKESGKGQATPKALKARYDALRENKWKVGSGTIDWTENSAEDDESEDEDAGEADLEEVIENEAMKRYRDGGDDGGAPGGSLVPYGDDGDD